jgi:hypothetical protein
MRILNMLELERLIASTLYLMTRHSKAPKANLEQSVVEHLLMLRNHPDCNSKELKEACNRLSITWKQEARIKELGLDESPNLKEAAETRHVH